MISDDPGSHSPAARTPLEPIVALARRQQGGNEQLQEGEISSPQPSAFVRVGRPPALHNHVPPLLERLARLAKESLLTLVSAL